MIRSTDIPPALAAKMGLAKFSKPRGPNNWEAEFGRRLESRGFKPLYQPIRLRISSSKIEGERTAGAWYTPDWCAWVGRELYCWEVKGFRREAAMLRLKAAASLYPGITFVLASKQGSEWRLQEVRP